MLGRFLNGYIYNVCQHKLEGVVSFGMLAPRLGGGRELEWNGMAAVTQHTLCNTVLCALPGYFLNLLEFLRPWLSNVAKHPEE